MSEGLTVFIFKTHIKSIYRVSIYVCVCVYSNLHLYVAAQIGISLTFIYVLFFYFSIGHSRTVVGIEERKNRTLCLLVFDPGCPSREMQKLLKPDMEVSSLKQLRKFVGNLKHKQYQVVAVEGVLSSEEKIVSI